MIRSFLEGVTVLLAASFLGATELSELVDPGAEVTEVAKKYKFTEGPAYGPQGLLLFSDIPSERIIKVAPDGAVSDLLRSSGMANGLMFAADGKLYVCQSGARQVSRMDLSKGNELTVLVDSYNGKKLNGPNDLGLDAHGGLYFTDPDYMVGAAAEQHVMGVYYLDSSGTVSRIIEGRKPNGILVSPNGKYLYVAEHSDKEVIRYDIVAPGKVSGGKLIFTGDSELDGLGPDGMAHDVHGNVYTTYKKIVVLDPDGGLIGRISIPKQPTNCTFGGADRKTLYITAISSVYSLPMKVAGMALQPVGPVGPRVAGDGQTREVNREVKLRARTLELTLQVPASWEQKKSTSSMRLAEFVIPALGGDSEPADLVLYYTGLRGMGPVDANIERWVGQIDAKGRKVKIFTGKSKNGRYTLVDGRGTYLKPVGPPIQRKSRPMPGAQMLAMILETEKGPVYLKLTGPEKTVTGAADDLRNAVGVDLAEEKER